LLHLAGFYSGPFSAVSHEYFTTTNLGPVSLRPPTSPDIVEACEVPRPSRPAAQARDDMVERLLIP